MAGFATSVLRWSPDTFWGSSRIEHITATLGYMKSKGLDAGGNKAHTGMTLERYNEIKAERAARRNGSTS